MWWTWFFNPKNLLLTILAATVVVLSIMYFVQKASHAVISSQLREREAALQSAAELIEHYQDNIRQIEALGKKVDSVRRETVKTAAAIGDLKFDGGGQDEKAVALYNSMLDGLRYDNPGKTDSANLPQAGASGTAKAQSR